MKEKPYKQNKSALKQFLEKKEYVEPIPTGAEYSTPGMNEFRKMLDKIYLSGSEEDKDRLEAIGWTPFTRPSKERDLYAFRKLRNMQEDDQWRTVYGPNAWIPSGRMFGKTILPSSPQDTYFVAGKGYSSRSEYLLSRTGLGKELL